MVKGTIAFLKQTDEIADRRRQEILNAKDCVPIQGISYYVSNHGNDANDGKTPASAWRTLARVSDAELCVGDAVLFRRGDLFRGAIRTRPGVTYAAYGEGEKPKLYGWDKDLADPALWTLCNAEQHIWKYNEKILDCGTLVFNSGEAHSRKLIPSYINGQFVCRDDESRMFDMACEMTEDLDIVCFYTERMDTKPSKGEDFPVPVIDEESYGDLYLRCDKGNPGDVFTSVEALPRRSMLRVGDNANVRIDNLCLKYIGLHAIAAGGVCNGLHVTNCEIGWIGGTIQHYWGTDPNYPEGRRGTVTRFGNGIEIYGGCDDYVVENCYIYQVYDAGITHQVSTYNGSFFMKNIRYADNLIEYCVYGIEYFLDKINGDTASYIENCEMCGNIIRHSGYGWGQQRHNKHTPAHIKGWSYENTAHNYSIHDNILDRAAYRMVHLVAKEPESCPVMYRNTYIQKAGLMLGQYGANREKEPEILYFDKHIDESVYDVMKDEGAKIYVIE
ncbi:MAG: hypothetical protein IJX80_11090 [Clostridia bacterium]|nr:hypothetical protein [Clostridia bacterium]